MENHCSIEQQKKMVKIFTDVFEDKLYVRQKTPVMPTPEGLKGKIIVKVRNFIVCLKMFYIDRFENTGIKFPYMGIHP